MRRALGVAADLDGMPLAAAGAPPRALTGWTLARHRRLHDRARRIARRTAARWHDADLDPPMRRTRPTGGVRVVHVRWILHHVLEHQAGHYGQILLLRHLHRERGRG